jgi:hypothetical protein
MNKIEEILKSTLKPKEKVSALVKAVGQKEVSAKEFIDFFKEASNVEKGTCADVMKHVSKYTPEILGPYIHDLIEYINYDLPRVKWGVPEAIGNLSEKYPQEVEEAIPKLLKNVKEDSTVIRWCAAYALTEIVKNNPKTRKQLIPLFEEISKTKQNNGVKNVYQKVLKLLDKGS